MSLKITSEKTIIVGFIAAYISMIAPILGLIFGNESFKLFFQQNIWAALILVLVLLTLPLVSMLLYNPINNLYRERVLKKRKLSGCIIEQQNIIIDITHNGRLASYYEKTTFFKIKKGTFDCGIEVSGTIKNFMSALNCSGIVSCDKKKLDIIYTDQMSRLNSYPSLLKQQNKFLIYTALIQDTFLDKEEYWDILPRHYCKNYCLEIILPKGKKVKMTKICKVDDLGKEQDINHIYPLIIKQRDRYKIMMQIADYDYGEKLRLKWKI